MDVTSKGLFKGTAVHVIVTFTLLAVLVLSVIVAVTFGTVSIPFVDVYRVILQGITGNRDEAYRRIHDIVWLIRLPRLILAIAVGASLSICGLAMQAIVKNPLADPFILGVSSGAYAGVAMAILLNVGLFFGVHSIGVMGFIGAFTASMTVVFLANVGGKANPVKLILAGTAVGAVSSAFSNFLIYFNTEAHRLQELVSWTMGSLGRATWSLNAVVMSVMLTGFIFFWSQHRRLNLMLLGDEAAITLGADLHKWRILYLLVSSLMVGFAVFSSGMIGFVGLVIPHAVRMMFGVDHKKLIPLCALVGAIFLIWADVLARILITGAELPIGILTSMIGAPCFIYLMARKKYGFGGSG